MAQMGIVSLSLAWDKIDRSISGAWGFVFGGEATTKSDIVRPFCLIALGSLYITITRYANDAIEPITGLVKSDIILPDMHTISL